MSLALVFAALVVVVLAAQQALGHQGLEGLPVVLPAPGPVNDGPDDDAGQGQKKHDALQEVAQVDPAVAQEDHQAVSPTDGCVPGPVKAQKDPPRSDRGGSSSSLVTSITVRQDSSARA